MNQNKLIKLMLLFDIVGLVAGILAAMWAELAARKDTRTTAR